MIKFIKHKYHNVKSQVGRLHELCKQTTNNDLVNSKTDYDLNLYQLFFGWLLDYIIMFGVCLTFIHNTIEGWQSWRNIALVISYGIGIWVLGLFIREIRKAFKDDN